MGQERECKLRHSGRTDTGKAWLETDYILFRGAERLKILLKDLTGVRAEGSALRLDFPGGPAVLDLGDAAPKWARKILRPPSRLEKLGVKPGAKVRLVGDFDADFLAEVGHPCPSPAGTDLVFLAAEKTADLRRVSKIAASLPAGAALWIVYLKGVEAIRESQVIEAGRAAGLKDTKVARFSDTHTALRFSVPKST